MWSGIYSRRRRWFRAEAEAEGSMHLKQLSRFEDHRIPSWVRYAGVIEKMRKKRPRIRAKCKRRIAMGAVGIIIVVSVVCFDVNIFACVCRVFRAGYSLQTIFQSSHKQLMLPISLPRSSQVTLTRVAGGRKHTNHQLMPSFSKTKQNNSVIAGCLLIDKKYLQECQQL